MTQTQQILDYLEAGHSITPLEALKKFGCMRLGARVYDLKQHGYVIISRRVHDERTGKHYACYQLAPKKKRLPS